MGAPFEAWADQEDARLRATIRKYGWSIEYIGGGTCSAPACDGGHDDGPSFAYTVGLLGLGPHDSAGLLNTLGDEIKAGEALISGIELTVDTWPHR